MLAQGRPFTLRPPTLAPSAYIRVHLRLVSVFGPIRGPYSRAFAVSVLRFLCLFAAIPGFSSALCLRVFV